MTFLTQLLDPAIAQFCECTNLPQGSDPSALAIVEGRLTWLVYIVGAVVRGRLSCSSAEPQVWPGMHVFLTTLYNATLAPLPGMHCPPRR